MDRRDFLRGVAGVAGGAAIGAAIGAWPGGGSPFYAFAGLTPTSAPAGPRPPFRFNDAFDHAPELPGPAAAPGIKGDLRVR
jgi:hypothetical protein